MLRLCACLLALLAWPASAVERVISLAPSLSEIVVELDTADFLVGVLDGDRRLCKQLADEQPKNCVPAAWYRGGTFSKIVCC